jgi:hypothetical protein
MFKKCRSATTNDPLRVRPLNQTKFARNRRVRDLYVAIMGALEDHADNMLVQAAVLRSAELRVIGEQLRAEMLTRATYDLELGEELVRIENMIRRAETELAVAVPERKETHQQFIMRVQNEARKNAGL